MFDGRVGHPKSVVGWPHSAVVLFGTSQQTFNRDANRQIASVQMASVATTAIDGPVLSRSRIQCQYDIDQYTRTLDATMLCDEAAPGLKLRNQLMKVISQSIRCLSSFAVAF